MKQYLTLKLAHSVREFTEKAFKVVGITIKWQGEKEDEVGIDASTGKIIVRIDDKYYRPAEVNEDVRVLILPLT